MIHHDLVGIENSFGASSLPGAGCSAQQAAFRDHQVVEKRLERSSVKAEIVSLSKELSEKSVHNLLLGHIHHHLPKIGDRSIQPFCCSAGNNVTQYTRVLKRAEAKSSTFIKRETPALR